MTSLALLVALAWLYLWRDAGAMREMDMVSLPLVLGFAMWTVMMTGMMVPSAAPTILFYSMLVRKNSERGSVLPAVWVFASGYLAVWTAFSFLAALLQASLEQAMLLTAMLGSASKGFSAAVLVAAGIYQWLPIKQVCLRKCRNPIEFFTMRWRAGVAGAFRMGLEHGLYCLGCCWTLMLLLFVAGVMNLLWVALIAAFVFVEKLLPAERFTSRFAGVALVLSGLALAARP